jgi:hypothetical protein
MSNLTTTQVVVATAEAPNLRMLLTLDQCIEFRKKRSIAPNKGPPPAVKSRSFAPRVAPAATIPAKPQTTGGKRRLDDSSTPCELAPSTQPATRQHLRKKAKASIHDQSQGQWQHQRSVHEPERQRPVHAPERPQRSVHAPERQQRSVHAPERQQRSIHAPQRQQKMHAGSYDAARFHDVVGQRYKRAPRRTRTVTTSETRGKHPRTGVAYNN